MNTTRVSFDEVEGMTPGQARDFVIEILGTMFHREGDQLIAWPDVLGHHASETQVWVSMLGTDGLCQKPVLMNDAQFEAARRRV